MSAPFIHARGRMPSGAPNPIDVHVGSRIRERRVTLGLSQEKLGETLGLTFQQIQKYERGANRVGASRLWDLSQVLKVSPAHFFEGITAEIASKSPRLLDGETPELPADHYDDTYSIVLAKRIRKLDLGLRAGIVAMINTLSSSAKAAE